MRRASASASTSALLPAWFDVDAAADLERSRHRSRVPVRAPGIRAGFFAERSRALRP